MNTAIQAAFGAAFGPNGPMALQSQGRGNGGGVGGLAVATPVLGGVCRHKTYPHSYRRVGGRYRQSADRTKLRAAIGAPNRLVNVGTYQQSAFGGREINHGTN